MITIPLMAFVICAALMIGLNPGVIGLCTALIARLLGKGKSPAKLLWLGTAYVIAMAITVFIVGWLLGTVLFLIEPFFILLGAWFAFPLIIIAVGIVEIKDYFWYGKGKNMHPAISVYAVFKKWHARDTSWYTIFLLGTFAIIATLSVVGAPYLAVVSTIVARPIDWLIFSCVIALPTAVIIAAVAGGTRVSVIQKWKEDHKATIRAIIGFGEVAFGWLLLLNAGGVINIG